MTWLILAIALTGMVWGVFEHWQYGNGGTTVTLGAVIALAAVVDLVT